MTPKEKFLEAYMNRYANEGETQQECVTRLIEDGIVAEDTVEYQWFKNTAQETLRGTKKGKERDAEWLRLGYGPKCLKEDTNDIL